MRQIPFNNMAYFDYINKLYNSSYEFHYNDHIIRNITFQVTDDCCCCCSYCYQGNKGNHYMTKETGKKIVDLLFNLYAEQKDGSVWNDFINSNTKGLILDFIGGEPLMNIEVIDYICSYFLNRCINENHPWRDFFRINLISNGKEYFNPKVQQFLKKFYGYVCLGFSIDGPKEIHDKCRIYPDGSGNFDDAYKALQHYNSHYEIYPTDRQTKVTISQGNLSEIHKIIEFFLNEKIYKINANTVFEEHWTEQDGQIFYQELKKIANTLLDINDINIYCSLFDIHLGHSLRRDEEIDNYCGGTGHMLAFDPNGIAYPCVRYMESSLNNAQPPIIFGDSDGLFKTNESIKKFCELRDITRISQSSEECLNCPIATGCAWCSAWNYQLYGTANKRCTYICPMHKARVLANVYYWNKYYDLNNINDVFEMNLPKEDALNFIPEEEYNMLADLVQKQKDKINQKIN